MEASQPPHSPKNYHFLIKIWLITFFLLTVDILFSWANQHCSARFWHCFQISAVVYANWRFIVEMTDFHIFHIRVMRNLLFYGSLNWPF